MTKENDKLKRLLNSIRVPEPDEEAQERALEAAMSEFHRQKKAVKKKIKGFSLFKSLTGKRRTGGPVMRKPFIVTAGAAFSLILLVAVLLPQFTAYRGGPRQKSSDEITPKMAYKQGEMDTRDQNILKEEALRVPTASPPTERADKMASRGRGYIGEAELSGQPKPSRVPASPVMSEYDKKRNIRDTMPGKPDPPYVGRDRFETITPNPVKVVAEEPVSTFSIDVDTASYAFVRRALNDGVLPQKNAVRIEELINYFDYDYPLPEDRSVPFKPTIALFPTPWNKDTKLLQIGIKGFDMEPDKRPRSNLVFLIDVSGSMKSRDKLPLLKNAFRMLVETLDPGDRVAIVVYAGAAGTVLEPTKAKEKGKILAVLDRLTSGGSTAGGEGIRQAYALAEANFDPEGVNRVILATDGDFNVGIRNPEELKGFVERKRETGIYLTVLGFGQGNYNDALMQKLAQNGNGTAAYIDTLNEARKVLVDEANANLFTIAKDVKIQIEFNPARVVEYRLIGYETRLLRREDFNNDLVDAGDVGAGHSVTALYEITPVESEGRLIDDLRYGKKGTAGEGRVGDKGEEYAFLKIRYKLPDSKKSRLITTPIVKENEYPSLGRVPGEARFASAVAAFGLLLRGDPSVKSFTYNDVITLAEPVRGKDRFGYRTEFVNLIRLAKTARTMNNK
jgi:Ca-activated chloride channel family protein